MTAISGMIGQVGPNVNAFYFVRQALAWVEMVQESSFPASLLGDKGTRLILTVGGRYLKTTWLVTLASIGMCAQDAAWAREQPSIDYDGVAHEGLVGNGASIVKVSPMGYAFVSGGQGNGRIRLIVDGKPLELQGTPVHSSFFPGGVSYRFTASHMEVEILHGASADVAYMAAIRVSHAAGRIEVENDTLDAAVAPAGRTLIKLKQGEGFAQLSAGGTLPHNRWETLRARFEAPYREGFTLETPNAGVDRAVPFNRYLLDLGYNGHLHVCELFRWRDVWSRDLGSGLAPGAMAAGEFSAARTTIEYDLHRYSIANPQGLKVTTDPSQGGSAEGTAWLTRAVWQYYLLTGDEAFLRNAAATLRPWVNAWIDRDADDRGLLIDVTEWMDHSRFFLFPDGARVLYSNALFVQLLGTFAKIETTLHDEAAARRFGTIQQRFIRGINAVLWNEGTAEYDNLSLWGQRDERSSSDGNILAVLSGVAPADRVQRVLATVKGTNWRPVRSPSPRP
jgi:hypothetical protein